MQAQRASSKRRGKAQKPPTIRDVAQQAGVSAATVSRVLNRPQSVNADIVRSVQTAVQALGYIPNGSARALANKSTRTIGAVVPTIHGAIYAKMVSAMQQRLEQNGLVLFVATHEYSLAREVESVRALIERSVDAILLVGSRHEAAIYDIVRRKNIPLVLMCIHDRQNPWPTVGWDNHEGGVRIARHLVDLGHREFGIIGGVFAGNDRARDRVDGFVSALKSNDIAIGADRIVQCPYDLAQAAQALRHLVTLPDPPTAVLCGNDVLATGSLFECMRLGIRVPDDLSLTGYDDLDLAAHLVPPLTTLRIPAEQVGHLSAQTLIGLIEKAPTPEHVSVDVDLILRGTTSPPRQTRLPASLAEEQ